MPPRSTTPSDDGDDDFASMKDAMTSSPIAPPAEKRTHSTMVNGDDDGPLSDSELPATPALPVTLINQNVVTSARQYGQRKRLRSDQITEMELFLTDSPALQNAKLFANISALGNQLKKFDESKPSFEVSADLLMNMRKYAPAVLLSSKISVYKGDGATTVLTNVLKQRRFDLNIPSGIENVPADWAKLVAAAQNALTQKRSTIKKSLDASVKTHKDDKDHAPDTAHQNIFRLTQAIVKGTQCTVNVTLCARVALMRKVYLKFPGADFWDKLDKRLAKIRREADGDAKKIIKAFRKLLDEDQEKHGKTEDPIDETAVDEFQQGVDDLIDIAAINTATSVQGGSA
ncbi:hypothetical protein B0H14DRAFT_3141037 [Mycena olivaceomarginata]|nr:hypothetical protein B0H14DRAFT_3141037 [Mycena olivaceomarginata]